MKVREIMLTAVKSGNIEENLKALGYSTSVCVALRKRLGLVYILENGKMPVRLIDNINEGQKFWIIFEDIINRIIPKSEVKIKIVYEDEDYVVIDKQSGLAVIANHQHYGKSLENSLANIWGGEFIYRPINRLDKDTSGLMVVAKNQLAHSLLSPDKIIRRYLGIVEGKMDKFGIIDAPLGRQSDMDIRREVCSNGKTAITHFWTKEVFDTYSCVEFELKTGRTHQIRAHCAYVGHPLCCDKIYNENFQSIICPNGNVLDRQALHSWFISFDNPITKEHIELKSIPDFLIN